MASLANDGQKVSDPQTAMHPQGPAMHAEGPLGANASGGSIFRRSLRRLAILGAATVAVGGMPGVPCEAADDDSEIRYIDPDTAAGTSAAVVVSPNVALAHTALLLPVNRENEVVGGGDAASQADRVLSNLDRALAAAGASREKMVRLNVYAADYPSLDAARKRVAEAFPGPTRPAATWIVTAQPRKEVLVTMDAVAVAPLRDANRVARFVADELPAPHGLSHVTVMPPGEIYYISGQLEKGESLAEGVRNTMAGLHRTLEHFGLNAGEHVVQIKAFINPMDQSDEALKAIAESYDAPGAPPVVITEWQATIPGPTEIEMIAAKPLPAAPARERGRDGEGQAARFLTPPWMSASPVYSRAAVVRSSAHRGWVYFSGISAAPDLPAEEQAAEVFEVLQRLCEQTGCDFDHLIKATYYACDPTVSPALRTVRPRYYNAERPPAASLIHVRGVGAADGIYTLDMIGVSVK